MKSLNFFFKKVLIFCTLPILFILIGYIICNSISKRYKLDSSLTELFTGDSHIESGINDQLLTGCKNMGHISEGYYFTYFKLKQIISSNPNINRVYLGFSYHNLSNYFDDYITGPNSKFISPEYFFILPLDEQIKQVVTHRKDFPTYFQDIVKFGFSLVLSKIAHNEKLIYKSSNISHCHSNGGVSTSSMDRRLKYMFYTNDKLNGFSESNLTYLNEVIKLCKRNNIELVLINMPLHVYFNQRIPLKFVDKYKSILAKNNLKKLDFNNLKLNDTCFLPDGDHLSPQGATLVTKEFIRINRTAKLHFK